MSEVAKLEPQTVAQVQQPESSALISMIERAARDPSVDIDKMERLFQMHERVGAQQAKAAYISAHAEMQPELPVIDKNGKIERRARNEDGQKQAAKATKYARWEDVVEAINPILAKHGFSLSFRIKQEQRVEVTAVLGHRGGHCEETSMVLGIDDSGAKNNIQGWGSSVSYGKRYTAFALLNIVARGEDDDGKAAGAGGFIAEDQQAKLRTLLDDTGTDVAQFLQFANADNMAEIPARDYARLHGLLTKKKAQKGAKS